MVASNPLPFIRRRNLNAISKTSRNPSPVTFGSALSSSPSQVQEPSHDKLKNAIADIGTKQNLGNADGVVRMDRLTSGIGYITITPKRGLQTIDYLWEMRTPQSPTERHNVPLMPNRRLLVDTDKDKTSLVINLRYLSLAKRLHIIVGVGEPILMKACGIVNQEWAFSDDTTVINLYPHEGEIFMMAQSITPFASKTQAQQYFDIK